jgi:phosphoribosylformimino-5-aminoimidazole carboxamide ribotide isomerase
MIEIIPAIDIIEGSCVRLTRGDFLQKTAYGDPLEMARQFEDHAITRLHFVDLDGAREKRVVNYRVLEQIAAATDLVIDAGGGIRTEEDIRIMFESGAQMVTIGSIAVREKEVFLNWLGKYGPDRIILGADFREGNIAISGWHEDTSLDLMEFIAEYHTLGVRSAICTDIHRDGTLEGPSLPSYKRIKEAHHGLHLIASGGISQMEDIGVLDQSGINGVIVGKAIYEGRISLKDLESYIIHHR